MLINPKESTGNHTYGLLVDKLKKMVYVTDNDKSIIHVFSYDGDYFGHLADHTMFLSQRRDLAIK